MVQPLAYDRSSANQLCNAWPFAQQRLVGEAHDVIVINGDEPSAHQSVEDALRRCRRRFRGEFVACEPGC